MSKDIVHDLRERILQKQSGPWLNAEPGIWAWPTGAAHGPGDRLVQAHGPGGPYGAAHGPMDQPMGLAP